MKLLYWVLEPEVKWLIHSQGTLSQTWTHKKYHCHSLKAHVFVVQYGQNSTDAYSRIFPSSNGSKHLRTSPACTHSNIILWTSSSTKQMKIHTHKYIFLLQNKDTELKNWPILPLVIRKNIIWVGHSEVWKRPTSFHTMNHHYSGPKWLNICSHSSEPKCYQSLLPIWVKDEWHKSFLAG